MKTTSAKIGAAIILSSIMLLGLLVVVGYSQLAAIGASQANSLRAGALKTAKGQLQVAVDGAESILSHYHDLYKQGVLSEYVAKQKALASIGSIRYSDGVGYVWVHRFDKASGVTTMVMHPTVASLNGVDISNHKYGAGERKGQPVLATAATVGGEMVELRDRSVPFFQMMNEVAKRDGEGVVAYDWPKPSKEGLTEYQLKWSYINYFEPWGLVVGSGVYVDDIDEKVARETGLLEAEISQTESMLVGSAMVLGLLSVAGQLAFLRWYRARLDRVSSTLWDISRGEGDLTRRLLIDAADEVGEIALAFNAFAEKIQNTVKRISETSLSLDKSSTELSQTSDVQSQGSRSMLEQARMAEEASGRVDEYVSGVSTGVQEMGTSLNDIAHSAAQANTVAEEAVELVGNTRKLMSELGENSKEISTVIELIDQVASQTNLLALNATIESARAGEVGKGFAVVAGEVKNLANETSQAVQQISGRISGIQQMIGEAISAIVQVNDVMGRISEYQTTISGTVEEQAKAIQSVAEQAGGAVELCQKINLSITGVAQSAERSVDLSDGTESAATDLSGMAVELRTLVEQFRT